jgi:hypothetical protein
MITTCWSLFCGFMIKAEDFPDFWIFMYWLNPLHYVIEGLVTTQFHGDHSIITVTGSTDVITAQGFVANFYSDWRFKTRGYDIMALCLFAIVLKIGQYYCLAYVRHDKR